VTTPSSIKVQPNVWLGALVKAGQLALLFVAHLGLAWLISWGLRHGFHLDTGYVGIAFLTFFGPGVLRLVVSEVSKTHGAAKRAGELAAEEAHMAKKLASMSSEGLMALASQFGLGGHTAQKPADDSATLVGNYL
jgi:hypothetical protein